MKAFVQEMELKKKFKKKNNKRVSVSDSEYRQDCFLKPTLGGVSLPQMLWLVSSGSHKPCCG